MHRYNKAPNIYIYISKLLVYQCPLLRCLVNRHKSISILMKDGFSALLRLPSFSAGVESLLLFNLSQVEPLQQFHSKQGHHLFRETRHTLRMPMSTSAGDLERYTTAQYAGSSFKLSGFCILFIRTFFFFFEEVNSRRTLSSMFKLSFGTKVQKLSSSGS